MNTLSWLIYGIDVIGNLRFVIGALALFFLACFAMALLSVLISEGETWDWVSQRFFKMLGAVVGVSMLFIAIPERNTIYMIAASEAGQAVYQTPEAKEMLGDLRDIIAKQIKKLKDDK